MADAGDKLTPKWLVTRLNLKLAPKGSSITKTQGKHKTFGAYQLLDGGSGQTTYFTWNDVITLARELGLLGAVDSKHLD